MNSEQEEVDTNLKKIARTAMVLFICLIVGKVLVYIYRVIIARSFGAETYGVYSLATMIVAWFSLVASLGFSESLTRYLPILVGKKKISDIKHMFRFTLKVLIISSFLAGILLFIFSEFIAVEIFHNSKLLTFLQFFSLAIPLIVISTPFNAALRSYEKTNWQSLIAYVFHNVASVGLVIILLSLELGTKAIIFSYLLGSLVTLVSSYLISKRLLPHLYKKEFRANKENKSLILEFIKYSWPLLFASFVGIFYSWADSFALGYLKTAVEVGLYNAAMPIAMLLGITPELFMQLFFPLINKEYAKDNLYAVKEMSKQVNKWILIINAPAMVLLFVFPELIIGLLFGQEYVGAATALRILSISSFLLAAFVPVNRKIIQMKGKSRILFYDVFFAAGLNLLLNIFFIPLDKIWFIENSSGINGAAIATLISSAAMCLVFVIEARHYISSLPFRRKAINVFFLIFVLGGVFIFIKRFFIVNLTSAIFLSLSFLIAYTILLFLTGALDDNDISVLKSIKNKIWR